MSHSGRDIDSPITSVGYPDTLIILDCRPIEEAPFSGIGRFTQSLAGALELLAVRSGGRLKVWGISSGGRRDAMPAGQGFSVHFLGRWFGRLLPKPRVLWSTYALWLLSISILLRFGKPRPRRIVWIAPDNIDRPLLLPPLLGRSSAWSIIQVVHDLIPLHYPSPSNRALRFQLKCLLGVLRSSGVAILPVSDLTRRHLLAEPSAKGLHVGQIPLGLRLSEDLTRAIERINAFSVSEFESEFARLFPEFGSWPVQKGWRFVLGVGRDEHYKRWALAAQVVGHWGAALRKRNQPIGRIIFLHVCSAGDVAGAYASAAFGAPERLSERCEFFPDAGVVRLSGVAEDGLAALYRGADCYAQWSLLEGFGLPAAEAYLAGLPIRVSPVCGFQEVLDRLTDREETVLVEPEVHEEPREQLTGGVQTGYGCRVQAAWAEGIMPELDASWLAGVSCRSKRSGRRLSSAEARGLLSSRTTMADHLQSIIEGVRTD